MRVRCGPWLPSLLFFFNDTATTEIYTLSLHDALPIYPIAVFPHPQVLTNEPTNLARFRAERSEEHTSELQSPDHLVCRLLLEKKKKPHKTPNLHTPPPHPPPYSPTSHHTHSPTHTTQH